MRQRYPNRGLLMKGSRPCKPFVHSLRAMVFKLFLIVLLVELSLAKKLQKKAQKKEQKKAPKEQDRPNVLLLIADEHSGRVMRNAGNKIVKTPTLDALAESGVQFMSAYCQNPICVPSRASLGTGRMPSKLGVFGNFAHKQDKLRDTPVSLARTFAKAGYTAEWLGKEHWGTPNDGLGFGDANEAVRESVEENCKNYMEIREEVDRLPKNAKSFGDEAKPMRDDMITEGALKWLDQYDGKKPFFLGVSLHLPHFPFFVEHKYYNMYKKVVDLPRVTKQMLEDLPSHNKKSREKYKFDKLTNKEIKKARAMYYGMVTYVDFQMGNVIRKLEDNGLRDNTIIVYLSDHGEQGGQHGLWYKNSFYEDSVMVPLMFSYPKKLPARKTIASPVQIMDVFPTLCQLCNITAPKQLDGTSLMPIIRGKEDGWERHAISETYAGKAGRMVRHYNWKYCWYGTGEHQLFNMKSDPAEEYNLYGMKKYDKVVRYLHKLAMKDFIPPPDDLFG